MQPTAQAVGRIRLAKPSPGGAKETFPTTKKLMKQTGLLSKSLASVTLGFDIRTIRLIGKIDRALNLASVVKTLRLH